MKPVGRLWRVNASALCVACFASFVARAQPAVTPAEPSSITAPARPLKHDTTLLRWLDARARVAALRVLQVARATPDGGAH